MKNALHHLFGFLFIVLVSAGCSQEFDNPAEENDPPETVRETDPLLLARVFNAEKTIPKDKALEIALSSHTGLQQKSTAAKAVAGIEVLRSADFAGLVASGIKDLPDTIAYIVNYADDRGYSIVAADHRIKDDVISSVEHGNLHLEDAYSNIEAGTVFTYMEDYLVSTLREAEYLKDSLQQASAAKVENNPDLRIVEIPGLEAPQIIEEVFTYDRTPYYTLKQVSPLSPVEWGQDVVFNDSVKYNNCSAGTTPTGCVPLMVAQVMSYYKYPSRLTITRNFPAYQVYELSLDWNQLNRYSGYANTTGKPYMLHAPVGTRQMAARLMKFIGYNVGAKYECKKTGADYEDDGLKYLREIGFTVEPVLEYDAAYIRSSLDKGRIVTANGKKVRRDWGLFYTYEKGHAWIIDGYMLQEKEIVVEVVHYEYYRNTGVKVQISSNRSVQKRQRHIYHMNWGWNGSSNGYFVHGNFDANSPAPKSTEANQNYQYQKKVAAVYR